MAKMKTIITRVKGLFQKSEKSKVRDKVLKENIDFNNIIESSLKAKQLYDELKVVAHPDRFQEPEKINKATELFQLIHQNKGDYQKLLELKVQVYTELVI